MTTKWYVVFEDDSQKEVTVEEGERDAEMLKRFDDVKKTGRLKGREVRGMWIIDHATEQADVIRIDRRVPRGIRTRRYLPFSAR